MADHHNILSPVLFWQFYQTMPVNVIMTFGALRAFACVTSSKVPSVVVTNRSFIKWCSEYFILQVTNLTQESSMSFYCNLDIKYYKKYTSGDCVINDDLFGRFQGQLTQNFPSEISVEL